MEIVIPDLSNWSCGLHIAFDDQTPNAVVFRIFTLCNLSVFEALWHKNLRHFATKSRRH